MFEVLTSKTDYDFTDENSRFALSELRKEFSFFKIENLQKQRPVLIKEKSKIFYTFSSSKINRTISFLLTLNKIENHVDESSSSIEIIDESFSIDDFTNILKVLRRRK